MSSKQFNAEVRLNGDNTLVLHGKFDNKGWQRQIVIALGECYYSPRGRFYRRAKEVRVEAGFDFQANNGDLEKVKTLIGEHFPNPRFVGAIFDRELRRKAIAVPVHTPPREVNLEPEPRKSAAALLHEETYVNVGVLAD